MIGVLGLVLCGVAAQRPTDDAILREAKLALLDRDWEAAVDECEQLIAAFPGSPLVAQARFYRARGLEGAGREEEAVDAYDAFLRHHAGASDLQQDARTASLVLSRKLLERGQEQYWRRLRAGLDEASRAVREFAALQVGSLSDRGRAREAVPVLTEMVRTESNPDLQDRARIALLRLDTRALASAEEDLARDLTLLSGRLRSSAAPRAGWLYLRIYRRDRRDPEVKLSVPLALGKLVYHALGEEPRRKLRAEKGIDLDNFWVELEKLRGKILVVDVDGERIELWIE